MKVPSDGQQGCRGLSAAARTWEQQQLRAMDLDDDPWDAELWCPVCRRAHGTDHPPSDPPASAVEADDGWTVADAHNADRAKVRSRHKLMLIGAVLVALVLLGAALITK